MASEVKLPQLGQTMEEGTIVNYLVKIGDQVKKGDLIFEVETDKAVLEVESPAEGFVRHIFAEPGQTLLVGDPVMLLAGKDEQLPESLIDYAKAGATAEAATSAAAPAPPRPGEPQPVEGEIKLGRTVPLSRIQKITAQRMLQSKREIPCFYLTVKADVTDLVELRAQMNRTGDVKISYNDFIILAVAASLTKFPIMTGTLDGDVIRLADTIDVGLAIAVPDGLVAPVIKNASQKDVTQIARDSNLLIEKARANKLAPADFEGASTTVSNLGSLGIESFIPIVVPGQCSILGVGRITDTCVPRDNIGHPPDSLPFAIRKLMNLTLAVDHRIANGSYAAQFLDFVRKLLEDTSALK